MRRWSALRASRSPFLELSPHRVCVRGGGLGRLSGLVPAPSARARKQTTRALIIGGGPAGDAVAAGLRDGGFTGDIVLAGAEPVMPYERPHLSKGYLLGTVARDRLWLRPADQYRELGVELTLGERVADLGGRRLHRERIVGEAACWFRAWALFAGAGRRGRVAGLDH